MADYLILNGSSFTLSGPGGHKNFPLAANVFQEDFVSGGSRNPIIAFLVRPLVKNVKMRIEVNSTEVHVLATEDEDKLVVKGYWQNFDGGLLKKNQANTIHFEVDEGEVRISDVVLWFQRNV